MSLSATRIGLAMPAILILLLLSAEAAARPRTLQGKVLASNGETLKGAVLQLKNTQTLRVRSFISQSDGGYRFVGLSPDIDYEVFARHQGVSSATKTVSQFDSSEVVELDLVIER